MTAICPSDINAIIESTCAAVRAGALAPYSKLLRTNVSSVITDSFPRFAQRVGADSVETYADAFIREHGATLPQFHHIATEFLRFSDHLPLDHIARCLLEYEWTQLSVEISGEIVRAPATSGDIALERIELNPTARLVALPFNIHSPEAEAEDMVRNGVPPFVYAIYRTADHRVLTQHLASDDIRFLTELEKAIHASASISDDMGAAQRAWLARTLQQGLIVLRQP